MACLKEMSQGFSSPDFFVMGRLKRYRVDVIIIAGFFVLPLLLFWNVTVGGQTMLPVDNLYQWAPWTAVADQLAINNPQNPLISDLIIQNYVWKSFIRDNLTSPTSLLWNPNLFAGVPFLATGQHGAYYPFSALFLMLPLSKAYGWYAVSQIWLAGALLYVYGRVLGMRRSSAALAGLVYQGGGYLVVSAVVFPMISGAVVWLPLLLACIDKVIRGSLTKSRATWLWAGLGAVALGTQILAGHIEFTIYTLLVMAVYAAWRLIQAASHGLVDRINVRSLITDIWLRPFLWLSGMVLLGLMVGAIQLVPLFEIGQANFREASSSFSEVQSYAFPPRRIVTLVMPNFFGNPAHQEVVDILDGETVPISRNYAGQPIRTTEWGFKNYVEGGIYLGILPLLLAFLGLVGGLKKRGRKGDSGQPGKDFLVDANGRRWTSVFYLLLGGFSFAFIFGTPLYALLYYGLPFVNQLHTPFRWVFPLSLAVAVLAGFGADYLATTRQWQTLQEWRETIQAQTATHQAANVFASDASAPWWLRPLFLWGKPSLITALAGFAFWAGLGIMAGLFASRLFYGQVEPLVERLFPGHGPGHERFPWATAVLQLSLPASAFVWIDVGGFRGDDSRQPLSHFCRTVGRTPALLVIYGCRTDCA